MSKVDRVRIESHGGVAKVTLNGEDISDRLLGLDVSMNGGDSNPKIWLNIYGELEFDWECEVDAEAVKL